MMTSADIGIVAIGRNEGERFLACLESLKDRGARLVYVDSGSSDGSVQAATAAGVQVVELDMARPFTAARARNAGFAAFAEAGGTPDFVYFIDGDCQMCAGWLDAAGQTLREQPDLGIVTGWLSERYPDHSVYNAMCHHEWHGPVGEIAACGGLMMVRGAAFEAVNGFDETVIAAEDDEFCIRIRTAGWKIRRIPVEMALHDANITRFAQWWKRMERAGHAFGQVGAMHPDHFRRELMRLRLWGVALPALFLAGLIFGQPWISAGVLALYALSWGRTARGLMRDGLSGREAAIHAAFLTLSKFPGLVGWMRYRQRQRRGDLKLIEYK